MPTFELSADGATYQVEAPNEQAAYDAFSKAFPSQPKAEEGSSLAGTAKSLGVGLAKGVIGLAGIPGDAANLIAAAAGTASLEAEPMQGARHLQRLVEGYTGKFYEPKGVIESGAQRVGEFLPAAVGGPESLAARLATRVAAPALGAETAAQLTKGTELEGPATVAGALLGGAAAGKVASMRAAVKVAPPAAPTVDAIDSAKTALYNSPEVQALRISPNAVEKVIDRAIGNAKSKYIDAPQTYRQLELMKTPMNGPTFSILDLENGRRGLNDLKALGGAEGKAATMASNYLDNVMPHWGKIPGAVVAGDARAAAENLTRARQNAAVGFRSELVQSFLEKAQNNATATHSGGNLENEIYKQIRTALNNPNKYLRGWNAAEKQALKDVLPGLGASALRRAGKLLGGGGGLGQIMSGAAGGSMLGWPGAVALPALGLGANKLGSSLAKGRLSAVDELLRSRAPLTGVAAPAPLALPAPQRPMLTNAAINGLLAMSSLPIAR